MARAGAACCKHVKSMMRGREGAPLILCGPGGNGGDGYVIARLLREAGHKPAVFPLGAPPMDSDAAKMLAAYVKSGGKVCDGLPSVDDKYSIVVDALFGAGLSRPFDNAEILNVLRKLRAKHIPVFAVDMPSGLSGDTGRVLGDCAGADLTLTFFTPKPGHIIADGPVYCGNLKTDHLGTEFPREISNTNLITNISMPEFYQANAHKYSYGHALIFSGGMGRSGAARLSALAALRMGAGLVTIAAPEAAIPEIAAQITSLQIRQADSSADVKSILTDKRYNTIAIGPGFGTSPHNKAIVKTVLKEGRRAVLDADALTAFSNHPEELFDLTNDQIVLTPHAGEFVRLFPDLVLNDPKISKIEQVRAAANRSGAIVLLKGPDTIIAAPSGEVKLVVSVYDKAAPMLATAGSGDVLTGLIAGRLARNMAVPPLDLTGQAVWIHQTLGRRLGPGMIAEDMPDAVPGLLGEILA